LKVFFLIIILKQNKFFLTIFIPETPPNPIVIKPLYFYHPDHLGTSTFLTDANGAAYQFFLNLPFGETMAEQRPSTYFATNYKFNGKELDEETGLYYYGARYYDPRISIWYSVDPLAEKYPNIGGFVYCADNPINFIDPDGRKIVYAKNATKEFKRAFASTIKHLKAHNADGLFAKLQKSDEIYTLKEGLKNTHFNSNTNEIIWDPKNGVETTTGNVMSPTAVLNHEADHAVQGEEHPIIKTIDKLISDEKYTDKEEKRVIQGSEQTPQWSPYAYAMDNPVKFNDPTGMSAEDPNDIHLYFNSTASKNSYVSTVNNAMGGMYKINSDPLLGGKVEVTSTGVQGPMTEQQQAFHDEYTTIAESNTPVTQQVLENSNIVNVGSFKTGKIDMSDVSKFDIAGPGGSSSAGAIIHETVEQYEKSKLGLTNGDFTKTPNNNSPNGSPEYDTTHATAIRAENKVNGNRRYINPNGGDNFIEKNGTITNQTYSNTPNGDFNVVKKLIP
jgi:RHS repeat-associated protein